MILAQVEHIIVHETRISSGTPWYITAIPVAIIAIAGWFFVHRATQSRDLLNWRRTTLLTAVSTLIEASNKRLALITKGDDERNRPKEAIEEQEQRIMTAEIQINACMAEDVTNYARAIKTLHSRSNDALYELETSWISTPYEEIRSLTGKEYADKAKIASIDHEQLEWNHQELMNALQIEIKLRKYEFNPDHAQVVNIPGKRSFKLPARFRKWRWTKKHQRSFKAASKQIEKENKNASNPPK